jgi:Xaa-Pro aminopeptidase
MSEAMNKPVNQAIYAQRRARLAAQLGPDAVAIVPTAPEQQRNRDSDFLFRHDSYFYYLSGFTEPQAWLVIESSGRSTLFCQPKDLEREIWDGYRLGPEAAPQALGVDAAHPVTELADKLPKLLENKATVWYPFATHAGLESQIDAHLQKVRARVRFGVQCPDTQRDLCSLLDEMRLFKDVPCRPAPACCAKARRCASTTSMPSCCTSSAWVARNIRPMAPSSPQGRTLACCTTGRMPRPFARASWC